MPYIVIGVLVGLLISVITFFNGPTTVGWLLLTFYGSALVATTYALVVVNFGKMPDSKP